MAKILQQTKLSETTVSYRVRANISNEKSFDDYLENYRKHRDRQGTKKTVPQKVLSVSSR